MCALQTVPHPQGRLRVSSCQAILVGSAERLSRQLVRLPLLCSGPGPLKLQYRLREQHAANIGYVDFWTGKRFHRHDSKRVFSIRSSSNEESHGQIFYNKPVIAGGDSKGGDGEVNKVGREGEAGPVEFDKQGGALNVSERLQSEGTVPSNGARVDNALPQPSSTSGKSGQGYQIREPDSHSNDTGKLEVLITQSDTQRGGNEEGDKSGDSLTTSWPLAGFPGMIWDKIRLNSLVAFISSWPAWQQRKKLERLIADADANPKDATKQAALMTELYKQSPQAAIERFEKRDYATDGKAVVEYLRALVATNAIAEYLPDERTGRPSGLPNLLQGLKQRAAGDSDELLAPPGMTEQQPLHVVMAYINITPPTQPYIDHESFEDINIYHPLSDSKLSVESKASNKSIRFIQELISTVLFMIIFSIMWTKPGEDVGSVACLDFSQWTSLPLLDSKFLTPRVMGAAALRKYVNGVAGMGSAGGMSGNNVYAPKEYSKETTPEKNVKTFNDVKGCDEAKAELEEIVEYLKNPAKFTRLGGKLPKGVLLIGPPGTGKTLLAKAIAGEAGVPFFYRAGSEFEEMFVGVGARRVRSLFQAAKKKAPCIVFIDEIDAVGGSRKQWEGHTKKTLNQLLVEMDGFDANEGIIVLAATNLPETLDPALTRPGRFDRHVVVTNPDVRGRQEILDLYLQDKPLGEDVDVTVLARGTPGFSGADLANLVNMAAVKAAVDGIDKITTNQLEFAKDKLLMGTERKSMSLTEESRKLTAYHESGHAVVAFNTTGANPIHKATITPRGMALGMVTQLPDKDETSVSKRQMLARLDVCMGGRVAEEMVFGPDQVTSGARSDLQQATALARHMVTECGMSDAVGPVFIDTDSHRASHDFQKSIDAEVVRLLKEAYDRVRKLLKKHEADLHALARALLEHETLNSKDIRQILNPLPLEELETAGVANT